MTGTLYVHIGTHKTGTSSIQGSLRASRAELKAEGVTVISPYPLFRPIMRLTQVEVETVGSCRDYLFATISRTKSRDASKFVISFEGLSGNPRGGYKNTRVVADVLRRITEGIETKIIVFLRRQDTFLESYYTQSIKEGASWDFDAFLDSFDLQLLNWHTFLSHYAEFFGPKHLIVRRYSKMALPAQDSLIKEFATIIGSRSLARLSQPSVVNTGYSRDALEIARLSNPTLDEDERRRLRELLQSEIRRRPFENYAFFTTEQRHELISQFEESNSAVVSTYMDEPGATLFCTPKEDVPEPSRYSGLTPEAVIVVLVRALLNSQRLQEDSYPLAIKLSKQFEGKAISFLQRHSRLRRAAKSALGRILAI